MASGREELSAEDLAAFDILIDYMKETNQQSMNLRQFLFYGMGQAQDAHRAAKEANERARDLKDKVNDAAAILREIAEVINPNDVTLGQLNREISLEQLIVLRRSLGH